MPSQTPMNRAAHIIGQANMLAAVPRLIYRGVRRIAHRLATSYWKLAGVRIASGSIVQLGAEIDKPRRVVIGKQCYICSRVRIFSEGDGGRLVLGEKVKINQGVILDHTGEFTIESGVLISEDCLIYTHSHGYDPRSKPTAGPLVIGARSWIGARALILPSVRSIGHDSIVAAGAVVTSDVAPHTIVAGNPARVVRVLVPCEDPSSASFTSRASLLIEEQK